jgi:hypothetical protein
MGMEAFLDRLVYKPPVLVHMIRTMTLISPTTLQKLSDDDFMSAASKSFRLNEYGGGCSSDWIQKHPPSPFMEYFWGVFRGFNSL